MEYSHYYSLKIVPKESDSPVAATEEVAKEEPRYSATPQISLHRLVEMLSNFTIILGHSKTRPVWFETIKPGSVEVVARVSDSYTKEVIDRRLENTRSWLVGGRSSHTIPPTAKAYDRLRNLLENEQLAAFIGSREDIKSTEFHPLLALNDDEDDEMTSFTQKRPIDGFIVRIGHSQNTEDVPVHLGNTAQETYLCRAGRTLAHRMAGYPEGTVFRVYGSGEWSKEVDGTWRVRKYRIRRFEVLPFQKGFRAALDRLQKTDFAKKLGEMDDPQGYLRSLREENLI